MVLTIKNFTDVEFCKNTAEDFVLCLWSSTNSTMANMKRKIANLERNNNDICVGFFDVNSVDFDYLYLFSIGAKEIPVFQFFKNGNLTHTYSGLLEIDALQLKLMI